MKNSITSLVPFLNKRDDSSLDCGYATSDYRYPFIMFSRDGSRCDLSFSDVSALCGDESASTWQVGIQCYLAYFFLHQMPDRKYRMT